jgi:hypothetical protein
MEPVPTLIALPNLTNPVTPWAVLVLVTAGWLAAYLFASSGTRS